MPKWILLRESFEQFRSQELRISGALVVFFLSITLFLLIVIESTAKGPRDNPARLIYLVILVETILVMSTLCPAFVLWTTCNERSFKTLELLRTTLIKPSSILTGKLLSLIFQMLFFMTLCSPFIYVIYLSSGVRMLSLISHLLIACISALSFGSISLFWSYMFRRNQSTVAVSFITIGTLLLGPLFVPFVLQELYKIKIDEGTLELVIRSISPLCSLSREDGLTLDWNPLTVSCLQHFSLSIVLLFFVYLRLKSLMGGRHGDQNSW